MGKDMVSLTIEGEVRQYPAGTSFLAISQEYQEKYPDDIVLVVSVYSIPSVRDITASCVKRQTDRSA